MLIRLICAYLLLSLSAVAQPAFYDESKVPAYSLPDVLTLTSGQKIGDANTWMGRRRPEIVAIYEEEVFGHSPARPRRLHYTVESIDDKAMGGRAVRKIVTVSFGESPGDPAMKLLVYLPSGVRRPVPLFLGLSFGGIWTVAADPGIPRGMQQGQPAPEKTRGSNAAQWQAEKILDSGYGLAVFYEGDSAGLRNFFRMPGESEARGNAWGSIAAWAWMASRAMDYLEKDRNVNAQRVALFGHSRLGKAALWAGARDTRFSLVIANESGEAGAAISRREYGERTRDLTAAVPHWFAGNFKKYADREAEMPFDSHMLLSLIAPRGLYVASAEDDRGSDPKGEFLGAAYASPVWALFGKKGIGTMEMPGLHQPVGDFVRYHIRAGRHDVTAYDWEQYLRFAAFVWK